MTPHEKRAQVLSEAIAVAAVQRGYEPKPVHIDPLDAPLDRDRAITLAIVEFYRTYGGEK